MSDAFIPDDLVAEMSPGQKQEYEALLSQKRARRSTLDYMLYDNPRLNRAYPHTVLLNEIATALVEFRLYKSGPGPASIVVDITEDEPKGRRVHPVTGEPVIRKLMTSMPPRIGKTFFWGKYFPAWMLTTRPDDKILYISYAAALSEEFSRQCRDVIMSHPELGVTVDPENASTKKWGLVGRPSGFIARGFTGVPTGFGGHMIIDDPFQDGEEAMNDDLREKRWTAYVSSLLTRVEADCFIVLNATRWHEDDMHGKLQEKEADEWYIVNIPAISFDETDEDGVSLETVVTSNGETYKVRDPLGRGPGKAICPELYPASHYLERKKSDPFWYEAEYLGKPSGIGGSMFKTFTHYKRHRLEDNGVMYEAFTGDGDSEFVAEKDCVRFGTADLAASSKESADWYVMGIWDMDPHRRLFLREVIREHVTGGDDERWLRDNYKKWNLRVLGVEKSTYDYKLIERIIIAGGINIWPMAADTNKKVRAMPAANLFRQRLVFIDRDAEWRPKYESEMKKFDKDAHDDQVDMTSYGAILRDLLRANPIPTRAQQEAQKGFEGLMTKLSDTSSPSQEKSAGMVVRGT